MGGPAVLHSAKRQGVLTIVIHPERVERVHALVGVTEYVVHLSCIIRDDRIERLESAFCSSVLNRGVTLTAHFAHLNGNDESTIVQV